MQTYLSFFAAILYLVCAFVPAKFRKFDSSITLVAWLVHAIALCLSVFPHESFRTGFANMLSAAMWISVLVYWLEGRNLSLEGLKLLLLVNAAVAVVLPVFFPGSDVSLLGKSPMFPWHLSIAILAFSTLTIAAFHAVVMSLQDMHLHQLRGKIKANWLVEALERLPALLSMEKSCFD